MDIDLWWLLLFPAFFGLGWLAARVDMRAVLKQAREVPAAFYKGLDALVDEQTDVAARSLSEVARAHPHSLEVQLSLGKLYRKRGENDRAIRLHQQVMELPDLSREQKALVRYELSAGFPEGWPGGSRRRNPGQAAR